nr:carbohydrate kinase family protein [Maliibacterium massiliense]
MERELDVLCVGVISLDMIMRPVSMDVMQIDCAYVDEMRLSGGGDAHNGAVDLSRMGLKSALLARLGTDANARFLLDHLQAAGVETRYMIQRDDMPTDTVVLCVDPTGDRHGVGFCKQGAALASADVSDEALRACRHMHATSINRPVKMHGAGIADLFARAKAQGCTTSMDLVAKADCMRMEYIAGALHNCDVFIPSNYEAEALCGLEDPLAMKEFFRPYGLALFGVKLGEKGVFMTDYQEDLFLPSFYRGAGAPVDTTGAGDAYFAGVLAGYLRGMSLRDCSVLGASCAALCIEQAGATTWARPLQAVAEHAAACGYPVRL